MQKKTSVLIVDDDLLLARLVQKELIQFHDVTSVSCLTQALEVLKRQKIDCLLLDLQLGQENGLPFIAESQQKFPQTEIVVISGQNEIKTAIECMRLGASDYLTKPIEPEELIAVIDKTIEKRTIKTSIQKLRPLKNPFISSVIGKSKKWNDVVLQGQKLRGKTQLNILILGESGTGKEVFSQFLSAQEGSPHRPFIAVNTPAIPANLLESELFGVEKGAFTDAKISRPGKFELAHEGDIFLDEIGDLSLEIQTKLLRVLQEKQSQRLGSQKYRSLRFRTISATNQNLAQKIGEGSFREDLFYRLSDMIITLPPLRERLDDIPLLAEYFLKKHSPTNALDFRLSEKAMAQLVSYSWPGNIRQLESTIKRAIALSDYPLIDTVPIMDWSSLSGNPTPRELDYQGQILRFETEVFKKALGRHSGKASKAMKELGLSKATFYRKLHELGLSPR